MGSSSAHEHGLVRSEGDPFALFRAAKRGDSRACATLISDGADVKLRDPSGWTALHVAAIMGHVGVCRTLADAGACSIAVEAVRASVGTVQRRVVVHPAARVAGYIA